MEKKTEMQIIVIPELENVIKESGLQLNESEEIKQSYLPYFIQIGEIKEQAKKINFLTPTDLDEKIARELRLQTVKVRTSCKTIKDDRKRIHLLKGNIEQAAYNLIESGCKLDEEIFMKVEKAREIAEAKRKEALRAERFEILSHLTENAGIYPLGEMSEDAFNDLCEGFKISIRAKKEAEQKAESERLAAIEAARSKQIEIEAENERLRIENLKILEAARQERIEAENKALAERKAAAIEKAKEDAERQAEQEKQDAIIEAQRKEAAKTKAASEAKLAKEKAENDKLKAALKAKDDAELKAKAEAEAKAASELKARLAAELKAKKAPDKDKLLRYIDSFSSTESFSLESTEAQVICTSIQEKFQAFKKWALTQIKTI